MHPPLFLPCRYTCTRYIHTSPVVSDKRQSVKLTGQNLCLELVITSYVEVHFSSVFKYAHNNFFPKIFDPSVVTLPSPSPGFRHGLQLIQNISRYKSLTGRLNHIHRARKRQQRKLVVRMKFCQKINS